MLSRHLKSQLKQILPPTLWNYLDLSLDNKPNLYHKKLKPHLPSKLKNKLSTDLWKIIADYCFDLDALHCPLSGELLTHAVIVKQMRLPYICDGNFISQVAKQSEQLIYDVELPSIRLLTEFALTYRQIALTDRADAQSKKFLQRLADGTNTINIIYDLKMAIEAEKRAGKSTFDLAGFLNEYDYPVMTYPDKDVWLDKRGIGISGKGDLEVFLPLFIWSAFHFLDFVTKLDSPVFAYLFMGDSVWYRALPTFLLSICNTYFMFDRLAACFNHAGSMEKLERVSCNQPASFASEILKWSIFVSDMYQFYHHSNRIDGFEYLFPTFEIGWLLSGFADIGCRTAVAECRKFLQNPGRTLFKPERDQFGFVYKDFSDSKQFWRLCYMASAAISAYARKAHPFFILMAIVDAFQSGALANAMPKVPNRFRLFANKSAINIASGAHPDAAFIPPSLRGA